MYLTQVIAMPHVFCILVLCLCNIMIELFAFFLINNKKVLHAYYVLSSLNRPFI